MECLLTLSSVQFICSVVSDSLWPHGLQQSRLPCPSLSPGVCSNSCLLSHWCHPTISSRFSNSFSLYYNISSVKLLSHVRLLATPWTAACQAPLSSTVSQSLRKLMSNEWVTPSNHLILGRPLLLLPSIFPIIGSFPMSQFFTSGGQSTGVSSLASFHIEEDKYHMISLIQRI